MWKTNFAKLSEDPCKSCKWFTIFFLDINDNIPEHFKRVNAIEKVFIRWFIWLFIWLLSFSDQSSLSDFKAGRCSLDATFYAAITRNLKERTKRLQNDGGNKSNQRWSTDERFWRFSVLPFFGRWPQSIHFSATVYILLSITIFLGNSLILVALHKESSLHPPSKLLYRCLATTDLFMSLANDNWSLCRYASDTTFTTSYTFCGVSLFIIIVHA